MFNNHSFTGYLRERGLIDAMYKAMGNSDMSEVVMTARKILRKGQHIHIGKKKTKSEEESNNLRKAGNELFCRGMCEDALTMYNRALLFAPKDSRVLKLAYSNRSAVFYRIGMLQECINDIDRCLSSNCPTELTSKLQKRKEDSSRLLGFQHEPPVYDYFKLESVNSKIPCASNDIDILLGSNESKIIAANDIKVGTVLIIEKSYVSVDLELKSPQSCHFCCQQYAYNLVPCDECCSVFFCSDNCKEICMTQFHKIECELDAIIPLLLPFDILMVKSVIKLVLSSTWDELIETSVNIGDGKSHHNGTIDVESKFCVLNLNDKRPFKFGKMFNKSFVCGLVIDCLENIPSFFPQHFKERQLAIRALARIMMCMSLYFIPQEIVRVTKCNSENTVSYSSIPALGLFPFIDKIKKSCQNNAIAVSLNNRMAVVAQKPFKRGMEVIILPYTTYELALRNEKAKHFLSFVYNGEICGCCACTENMTIEESALSASQTKIYQSLSIMNTRFDPLVCFQKICDALTALSEVPRSEEYKEVVDIFRRCIMYYQIHESKNYIL